MLTDNGMAFTYLPKNRDGQHRCVLGAHLRPCLRHQHYRTQADQLHYP